SGAEPSPDLVDSSFAHEPAHHLRDRRVRHGDLVQLDTVPEQYERTRVACGRRPLAHESTLADACFTDDNEATRRAALRVGDRPFETRDFDGTADEPVGARHANRR